MFRIGIVGSGSISFEHKNSVVKNPKCDLVAVCDVVEEKAQKLATGTQARVYTDYKELLKNETLDGVILTLPHFLHSEVAIFFLENQIPTLVEKPMANTVAECEAMIAASEKNKTPLRIGHMQRYFKVHRYLREIIREEKLGKFCAMIETRNVNYFPNRPKWFLDRKQAGGGILMNYGVHTLDKLFFLTGLSVQSVMATGNNFLTDDSIEASAQVLLGLSDGSSATFTYCGTHVPRQYDTYFYFTNGMAKIQNASELWISEGDKPMEKVELPGEDDAIGDQLEEFIKLISGKENELATPQYGRNIIEIIESAFSQFVKQ